MTDIFLAFQFTFLSLLSSAFGLCPKSTALLTACAINFKKMMPWKMITQKVMIMKIGKTTSEV